MIDFERARFMKQLENLRANPTHYIEFLDDTVQNVVTYLAETADIKARYNKVEEEFKIEIGAASEQEAAEIAELIKAYKQNGSIKQTASM